MDRIGILGQSAPSATTETALYTVPGNAKGAVASTITICNRSATPTTFRLSVSASGAATSSKDYLYYGVAISGNDTFAATIGVTLGAGDVVRCYASTTDLSFSIFGTEVG